MPQGCAGVDSACAETAQANTQRTVMHNDPRVGDDLRLLGEGSCRILAELGGLRACALFLDGPGEGGLHPVASSGAGVEALAAQLRRRDAAGAVAHARAAGQTTVVRAGTLVVVPLVVDDVDIGVMLGRRARHAAPLDAAARQALTANGRLVALSLERQLTALRDERARHARARLELARELHETVVQRLFAASLLLSASGPLDADDQADCATELQRALAELRTGLLEAADRPSGPAAPRLADELRALRRDPSIHVSQTGAVPELADHQDVATRSALSEAIRNARKHARDAPIHVTVRTEPDLVTLTVTNPTHPQAVAPTAPGVGLRLAAAELLEADGLLGHGPTPSGHWCVQIAVPVIREEPHEHRPSAAPLTDHRHARPRHRHERAQALRAHR